MLHHPILGVVACHLSPVLVAMTGRLRSLFIPLPIHARRVAAADATRAA
jgi:hypothetical protein